MHVPGCAQNDLFESRQTAITRAIEKISPAIASINVVQLSEFGRSSIFNDPFFKNFFPYELHRERVKSSGSRLKVERGKTL